MSEAERQRRLSVTNRRQELNARLGTETETEPESIQGDPSWGPLGSLARAKLDPLEYAALLKRHAQMLALERSRVADDKPAAAPPEQPKVTHTGVINLDGV